MARPICPLAYLAHQISSKEAVAVYCAREACAWWNPEHEKCCLAVIPDKLDRLLESIYDLFGEDGYTCLRWLTVKLQR